MQAVVCNSEGVPLDNMLTVQVPGNSQTRIGTSRNCSSPIELGKRLLLHAKDGDTEEVKSLISRGAPFTTDWLGISPLHLAAMYGHGETAEVLLRGGISRDARTKVDRTPLHIAAQEGHTDIVELLIIHGADLEAVDMLRMTALHWAVDRGHSDTVLKLLEHGANPNALSKFDKTPIIIAIDTNRADILDILQNTALYGLTKTSEEVHYINQLAEADSAAENLVVLSGESNLEEVVQTSHKAENIGIEMRGEGIKISFLNSSEKEKPKPKTTIVSGASSSATTQNNIQFLRDHGITMLPADDSNIVASAMESGQTVVLTEAGKLALNLTRGGSQNIAVKKSLGNVKNSQPKMFALSAEQLAALTGKATKLLPVGKKAGSPMKIKLQSLSEMNLSKVITTTTGKRVFPSTTAVKSELIEGNVQQVIEIRGMGENEEVKNQAGANFVQAENSEEVQEDEGEADLVTKLAQAKKEAEDFRKQLLQKEQEAEEYMKKLQSLTK